MDDQLKSNLTSRHHWLRLVFMILFAIILQVASLVMCALVAIQFLWALITGRDNDQLRRFGHSLATYIYDALQFLTYNTEEKPFPFAEWPELPAKREAVVEVEIVEPAEASDADDIIEETHEVVEEFKEQDEAGSKAAHKSSRKKSDDQPE